MTTPTADLSRFSDAAAICWESYTWAQSHGKDTTEHEALVAEVAAEIALATGMSLDDARDELRQLAYDARAPYDRAVAEGCQYDMLTYEDNKAVGVIVDAFTSRITGGEFSSVDAVEAAFTVVFAGIADQFGEANDTMVREAIWGRVINVTAATGLA